MRQFVMLFVVLFGCSTFLADEAWSARFGGGRSFGVQRSHSQLFSPKSHQQSKYAYQRPNQPSRMKHILSGILIGGLLTSLFMGHGFGTGMISWLVLGFIGWSIVNWMRKRTPLGSQGAYSHHQHFQAGQRDFFDSTGFSSNNTSSEYSTHPSHDFDESAFLRGAKVCFIRLQKAYDDRNWADLRSFTSPDVFAEIKMQLDEETSTVNHTEVRNLNAKLLDLSKQVHEYLASVHFTGEIQENHAPQTKIDEIWHFRQSNGDASWMVVGVQQIQH